MDEILNSSYTTIIINLFTVYALFGNDIRLLNSPKSDDIYYDTVTIISIVLFSLEIIFSIFTKEDYLLGFFFWLDFIATASMVFDI